MDPALRLQPGQSELTPAQEAAARRFAAECIAAQLSTAPVDEPETERLLCQAYAEFKLAPPTHVAWLDGPLHLVAVRAPSMAGSMPGILRTSLRSSLLSSMGARVYRQVQDSVYPSVATSVRTSVGDVVWASVSGAGMPESVRAYFDAPWHAIFHFFDAYLASNALHALAHFNERISGYWLGQEAALLVRRPKLLARDAQGRLHSAMGKCLEYPDGWGFYAWHGVRVPEQVILAPETLTCQDFLNAPDVEVRRVIQERMGSRFVSELGGSVLDSGSRGTLYEVELPQDPEQVARYVQVQDATSLRQYFLRVPPTVQTVAEAVAWSFQVGVEDYHPAQET